MASTRPTPETEVFQLPDDLTPEELATLIVLAVHDEIEAAVRAAINRARGRID